MIFNSWIWWRGYITVRLRGPALERLLNNVAALNIRIFKLQRLTEDTIIIRLGVKDFAKLRPLLWKAHINIAILDRHGFPFLVQRFKIRSFFAIGLILSLFIMVYLSNFIWFIEIEGNENLSPALLNIAAEDLGLQVGIKRTSVNPRSLESQLLMRFPSLAWVKVSVKGVKLQVALSERKGVAEDYGGAGHVYAENDGIITEILVLRGTPQVKEGDTVLTGDLLISGIYYDAKGIKQFGAAQGVVKARVWYEAVGEAPLTKWEPIKTGTKHRQFIVSLGTFTIPLGKSYSLENHLRELKEWTLPLGSAMVPISLQRIDYHEVQYSRINVSLDDGKAEAYNMAWKSLFMRGLKKENVKTERVEDDLIIDQDGIRVTVNVEVEEDIARFFSQ